MTRYPTRRYYTDGHQSNAYATIFISLPTVPGVIITADRIETDPPIPVIRTGKAKQRPHGVALQAAALRRAQWVREALQAEMDARE